MKVRLSVFLNQVYFSKGCPQETLIIDALENPIMLNRIVSSLAPSYIILIEPLKD